MTKSGMMRLYVVASIFCLGMFAGGFLVQWRYADYEAMWQERFEKQQEVIDAMLLAGFGGAKEDAAGDDWRRFIGILKAVSKE